MHTLIAHGAHKKRKMHKQIHPKVKQVWNVAMHVLHKHKHNSLPLGPILPSSPSTKELHRQHLLVNFSGIQTCIFGLEGVHADHRTYDAVHERKVPSWQYQPNWINEVNLMMLGSKPGLGTKLLYNEWLDGQLCILKVLFLEWKHKKDF